MGEHYDNCWRDHPACALEEFGRMREEIAKLRAERDALENRCRGLLLAYRSAQQNTGFPDAYGCEQGDAPRVLAVLAALGGKESDDAE